MDYLFYLTNQIKNPTVQFLELLVDDPDSMFNEAIQIENNKRAGNVSIARFFNVKKGKKKELSELVIKRKTKVMAKYYLNDDSPDMEKLGLDYSSDDDEDEESDISEDEKESENKNNNKYKKLFLDLGRI